MLGHLPERLHASVGQALRTAWGLQSAKSAKRALERLAGSLEADYPGAAASSREGLDETLTVLRLGLTGPLQRTLRTTNSIENLNGGVERYTRNVKRWRGGQMIRRWVASALLEAEQHFRRVRGYHDAPSGQGPRRAVPARGRRRAGRVTWTYGRRIWSQPPAKSNNGRDIPLPSAATV